jgi:cytochrome d ubiquinol oxidase subunit I
VEPASGVVILSRVHFGFTIGFHILWPVLTIGLSAYLVLMEALWLRTGQEVYYRQARFWGRLFLLGFGLGVATGVVMEFQFGTNWAEFSRVSGDFFGNVLGFEAAMAFAAEAAFLPIMVFGWQRVPRGIHMLATCVVAFGASLSAFWIMDASAWMQTPAGVQMQDGVLRVTNYASAILNPDLAASFLHMWVACLETGLFFVAGISAWCLLRGREAEFFLKSFRIALVLLIAFAPLQVYLGDASGLSVARHQPAKLAAVESHWNTNPPGRGAPWSVLAWPDEEAERNAFSLPIPNGLSLLATHSLTGQVKGLKEFPPADRPPILLPFYSFRLMVLIGFIMVALVAWAVAGWLRGWLTPQSVGRHRWLLRAWALNVPLGFVAVETGWIVREVGRQPWIIYGLLRTQETASTGLTAAQVAASLAVYAVIYAGLFVLFVAFAWKIVARGPDWGSPLPHPPRLFAGDFDGRRGQDGEAGEG